MRKQKSFKEKVLIVAIGLLLALSIALVVEKIATRQVSIHEANLGEYLSGTAGFLITFAALLAFLLAYLEQRKQIQIQENELKENNITNNITRFENNFFQLLNIHNNILNTIEILDEQSYVKGAVAFKVLYFEFYRDYLNSIVYTEDGRSWHFECQTLREKANERYLDFNKEHSVRLHHYMRTLYHILKYLDNNLGVKNLDIKFYANILRAQISHFEMLFVFYNGISDLGRYNSENLNFKKLIEKFSFFKHIDKNDFLNFEPILKLYDEKAYK